MKILFVIGTRPEAIKMAPLIKKFNSNSKFEIFVCNTGQHKDLIDPIINFFNINIDYNLFTMENSQTLEGVTSKIILNLPKIFREVKPDLIFVHGDTTTSFSAALAAFYSKIKVAHIEAGLRTYNKFAPYPEEMNRTLTARLADFHFAPTPESKKNLHSEGIIKDVIITGNTVIDALFDALDLINENNNEIIGLKKSIDFSKKIILFTGHRRENFGNGFEKIFSALSKLIESRNDIVVVYPVHPNPNVKFLAEKHFGENPNVFLINPLGYDSFIWLLKNSYLVITDSGGIQEEAPSLGKPVLVLRDETERPEAVAAGTVILVGSDEVKLLYEANLLLNDINHYKKMSELNNPYGDGKASERILNYFVDL
jgi:UDP-N-acetylglucosamine 2-epimerase (non-hydrolysing)